MTGVDPRTGPGPRRASAFAIDRLSVIYRTEEGDLPAVRDVSLRLVPGETLGLVGESGSGKTTLALAAIGYLPANGRVLGGEALLGETNLLALPRGQMRRIWGSRIGLVSQDPQAALNPALTIGRQLDEVGRRHLHLRRRAARSLTLDLLRRVDMPDPLSVVERYAHQLSGGMLQRAAIAMALLTGPELLILDEPTTALDVTTQAGVLDLLDELKAQFANAILYITHNLGVVARICDRVAIMYAGEIFEEASAADLFRLPLHPYTANLLNCVPRFELARVPDGAEREGGALWEGGAERESGALPPDPTAPMVRAGGRLATIPGSLPRLDRLPEGCVFSPRCPLALEMCRLARPPLLSVAEGRSSACLRWEVLLADSGQRAAISVADQGQKGKAAPVASAPARRPEAIAPAGARSPLFPAAATDATTHFLDARDIVRIFPNPSGRTPVRAVDGVTVWMDSGQTLGLVGESGSGKTTLARTVTGLSAPSRGRISMEASTLGRSTGERTRSVLRRLQMVFQNPESSLNPRRTVGQAIVRPLLVLGNLDRKAATHRAYELLAAVRLPSSHFHRYPAELSGGEKQRVAIARAFATDPDLVICDEPISSLDVSVQGSLMNLLVDLQAEKETAYLFISHDVAAVQHLSHRIAVMYLGHLMEEGEAARVLAPPYHPYTEALLSAIPIPDPSAQRARVRLRGAPPTGEVPHGCRFHPRCPRYLGTICETVEPPWRRPSEAQPQAEKTGAPSLAAGDTVTAGPTVAATIDHAIYCHIPLDELTLMQAETFGPGTRTRHRAPRQAVPRERES